MSRRLGLMRSLLSEWMPWQSSIGSRGRLSSSCDSKSTMSSMSGSGVSRCRLLHSLSAGLLVAGVGVSHCSVTGDDLLMSWLSPLADSRAATSGVRAERSSNCSASKTAGTGGSPATLAGSAGSAGSRGSSSVSD